jgi:hypothetical protein
MGGLSQHVYQEGSAYSGEEAGYDNVPVGICNAYMRLS